MENIFRKIKFINKFKNHNPSLKLDFENISNKYAYTILGTIVVIAFIFRILYFNQNPPSLNQDEAMNGYNSYSISKTLMDSRGFFLPSLAHGFGNVDFRSPLYMYLSVPFMWLMGLSETSTRLASLVFNTLLIPIIYIFVHKLINNKVIALISCLFLALNPWHFHYSRIGHEASISPFFYFLLLLLLLKALRDEKYKLHFIFTGIIMGISIYSYQVARVLSPMLFIFLCGVYYKESIKKIKYVIISALIAVTVAFPLIYSSVFSPGDIESRYEQVSIFHDENVIVTFLSNYFTHFSPTFLFFKGDESNIPGMNGQAGMFLIYVAPLMILGIYYLIKIYRNSIYKREIIVLFGLLLLYPLPTATTNPAPHALRAFTLIPIFEVISAIGIWYLLGTFFMRFSNIKIRLLVSALSFSIIMCCFGNFVIKYYFEYPKHLEDYYQFGIKEAVQYIRDNQYKYDKIYFTSHSNQPFVYFLFYLNYDPAKYIKVEKDVNYKGFGVVRSFDKYYFVPDKKMPLDEKNCLFICKASNMPGKELLKEIKNSSGKTIFTIWQ